MAKYAKSYFSDTPENERNFSQVKFDCEINACFLLNGHGNLYFFKMHNNSEHIPSYLIEKKKKN